MLNTKKPSRFCNKTYDLYFFQELTSELKKKFVFQPPREVKILGVDLDHDLIRRANESLESGQLCEGLQFKSLDLTDKKSKEVLLDFLKDQNRDKFDVIFCFSVTMWIHLNHGDEGLRDFIKLLASLSHFVILEPQPWKCYQTANRRMRKLKQPVFEQIEKIGAKREDLEPFLLKTCQENGLIKLKELGTTDWNRKAILFKSSN